ncbi:osmoprotectant transport system ATP-binding protein [Kineococcus xinjiangensis]|uniref:ABC-type quaternary amine transporter n=1 Tax=Kineococcus xinjiangensis TaxID=512762 RepID=A0A2S6IGX9_9ACTN|nr:ATP-binding cassette domain-containing protein [Kineococcus xinjiangensis]PPK93436.1 osmoprotectant transport system ATP-binding protein [Kineococcus xinjiangensis]
MSAETTEDHAADATGDVAIRLDGVRKQYPDGTVAVGDLTMDVRNGELVALVGPSGCGKSTILRMVNRLVEPSSGRILLHGTDVTHSDPVQLRRGIGYVIQAGGLLPHLDVRTNVGTVPKLLGWESRLWRRRADELLDLVGLPPGEYGSRYPHELSGGQQQRVGVARALAADPPVLLMDEPFGAVDPVVRERLQNEFLRIQSELRKTVLFVTHDLDEAVKMADRVAVLSAGGVLEQYADPSTLLSDPANEFVIRFIGSDRGLRRLAVTPIRPDDLDRPTVLAEGDGVGYAATALEVDGRSWGVVLDADEVHPLGWVSRGSVTQAMRVGARQGTVGEWLRPFASSIQQTETLRTGFSMLLAQDQRWLPVLDGDRYVGILTPDVVHTALRRGTPGHVEDDD